MTGAHQSIPVSESSQVSAARLSVTDLAVTAGFAPAEAHRAGIVATELATNLVKHTNGSGEMLLRMIGAAASSEIEILSLDRGPGISDFGRSLVDGYSTAGSPGTGLGAVGRLSDTFDIHTQPGRGTAVIARLRGVRRRPAGTAPFEVGGVSVPMSDEQACGDRWVARPHRNGATLLVVDGVGHGLLASDAAAEALQTFLSHPLAEPSEGLERIHDGLRHTRGAVAAIADVHANRGIVLFAGVGNITGSITSAAHSRQLVTHNGTLGQQAKYFRTYSCPWERSALLIMHSDGLGSQWSLDAYPGLRLRHPSLIAAVLYRDFARQRDDVTVIVGREVA